MTGKDLGKMQDGDASMREEQHALDRPDTAGRDAMEPLGEAKGATRVFRDALAANLQAMATIVRGQRDLGLELAEREDRLTSEMQALRTAVRDSAEIRGRGTGTRPRGWLPVFLVAGGVVAAALWAGHEQDRAQAAGMRLEMVARDLQSAAAALAAVEGSDASPEILEAVRASLARASAASEILRDDRIDALRDDLAASLLERGRLLERLDAAEGDRSDAEAGMAVLEENLDGLRVDNRRLSNDLFAANEREQKLREIMLQAERRSVPDAEPQPVSGLEMEKDALDEVRAAFNERLRLDGYGDLVLSEVGEVRGATFHGVVLLRRDRISGMVERTYVADRMDAVLRTRSMSLALHDGVFVAGTSEVPFEGGVHRLELSKVAADAWREALPALFPFPALSEAIGGDDTVRRTLNALLRAADAAGTIRFESVGGAGQLSLRSVEVAVYGDNGRRQRRVLADSAALFLHAGTASLEIVLDGARELEGGVETPLPGGAWRLYVPGVDAKAWLAADLPVLER